MLPPKPDRADPYGRAPPDAAHGARPKWPDRLRHASLGTMAAPHGSLPSGPGPTGLVEDPAEQEIIRQILELHAKGMGLSEIGRELDDAGLKCRQAKQWRHWQVRNFLRRA